MLSLRDFALILIVVFIWGTNFVAIRWGIDEMPPMFFTSLRFFMVVLPVIFFIKPPKIEWWKTLGVGLFVCTVQFGILFLAIELGLRAGLASLLMQAQVLFTIILSFLIFKERLSYIQFVGILLAFIGFGFFYKLRAEGGLPILPLLLALLAAFSWSCGNMIYKIAGDANRFHLTIYASLVPILPMLFLSFYIEDVQLVSMLKSITMKGWLSLAYNSYLSTIVAYTLWASLLGRFPAGVITPFALLIPIFGMLAAWALLGETITGSEAIASLLIGVGILISVMHSTINRQLQKLT